MRLEKIRIQNFRSFRDETVEFDPYTCLVGPNGAGKSTILTALNVFFRNSASTSTNVIDLCSEDFHHGNTKLPVRITLTFKDLSPQAQEELKHYFRQDRLVVSAQATWDGTGKAEVKQYGSRLVMKPFAPYFKASIDGEKAAELKKIYDSLQEAHPDLPKATSGPQREQALREFEESHPELCELVESPTQFFGFTKGSNLLNKYIQWVYVPAVKDASSEQQEGAKCALTDLLERTVRSKVNFKESIAALKKQVQEDYKKIVEAEKGALADLESSMDARLREWSSPNATLRLGWHYDDNKSIVVNEPFARASIGEDNFVGEVARLGHGMQRSFLVAVLHELASLNSESGPTLLLGFEEPELYQHPPQAQHMASVLEELATTVKTNTQVVISTHSPHFVSSKGFENVRVVRKQNEGKCSRVAATTYAKVHALIAKAMRQEPKMPSATMASIEQIMQPSQKELYFSRIAVLVEGPEDIGFLVTHMVVHGMWNDFRKFGCHFVVTNGKNAMSRPLAIAQELCIRVFAVIDGDVDKEDKDKSQTRDNGCILRLCGFEEVDPLPKEHLFLEGCAVWTTRIAEILHEEVGQKLWQEVTNEVKVAKGWEGASTKNKMFLAWIMEALAAKGFRSPSLDKLCFAILGYAERATVQTPTAIEETMEIAVEVSAAAQ